MSGPRQAGRNWPAAVLAAAAGGLVLVAALLPGVPLLQLVSAPLLQLARLLAGFLLLAAALGLLVHHARRMTFGSDGLTRHAAVVLGFLLVFVPGLLVPVDSGSGPTLPASLTTPFLQVMLEQIYLPTAAALFALPAFFTLQAMIDALQQRRPAALTVVISALIMLVLPVLPAPVLPTLGPIGAWLEQYVLTPTVRALLFSGAIGALLAGVRLLIGQDQPYAEQDR